MSPNNHISRFKSSIHTGRNPTRILQTPQRGRLSWTMSRPLRRHTLIPLPAFYGNLHRLKNNLLICLRPRAIICDCGHCPTPNRYKAPTRSPGPPAKETLLLLSSLHWRSCPTPNLLNILPRSPRLTGTPSPQVLSSHPASTQLVLFGTFRP